MNDQLYRAIFDAALDALVVVDDAQHFIAANPSACEIFGLPQDELLTRNLFDFILPAEQLDTVEIWNEFREKDQSQGEIRLCRADGTLIDVEFRATANIAPHRHLSILRPLTERHQAQAKQAELLNQLRDQQNRLNDILGSIPGMVWEAWGQPDAASQRIDFVSDFIEEMLGYKVEEWLETPNFWLSIVHPDDSARAAQVAAQSFADGIGHINEFRWLAKDGRVVWVEARAVVIKDENGKAVGMRGVTLDITARKKAEQALQFSEERFRYVFEQSPISMQILEPGGKTVRVNRAWEELWSLTLEQIKEYNMLEDPQLIAKGIMPYLLRAFGGESTRLPEAYYDPEQTLHIPSSSARWTRPVAYPIQHEGVVTEVVLTHENITDWKQSERNLQFLLDASGVLSSSLDYEDTLRNLAEFAVPSFADYCAVDMFEGGIIRRVALAHRNPQMISIIEEADRKFPQNLDAPVGVARVRRTGKGEMAADLPQHLLEAVAQNEEHLEFIRRLKLKSYISIPLHAREQIVGAITWVRDSDSPSFDSKDFELATDLGRRASIAIENASLYRDATEALASAEAANRAKDDFLAVVSHELRTPLNAISGWASLLRHDSLDAETTAQALEVIERNCYVQGKLVEDILEISRIVGGSLELETKPTDLSSVINEAMKTVGNVAQAKAIKLDLALEPSVVVEGDEVRLQQVITNLVSNAIKFTGENGQVQIRLSTSGSEAEIRVLDNGQGISADFLPFVFERFRQADGSSTRRYGGLGLGLAIVRHLVELHGGTVQAESTGVGQGSTFTVRLPLLRPAPGGNDDESASPEDGQRDSQQLRSLPASHFRKKSDELSGLTVLVVDDEPDAGHLVELRLQSAGAHVVTVLSAREALRALGERKFSLLISDIAMPEENGYSLIQQVRALDDPEKSNIAAIALTAFASPQEREHALAAGFQMHLAKPIDSKDLIKVVAKLCKTKRV
jgi:PAS domain S-box-containing protein